jgi:hypothetical protein
MRAWVRRNSPSTLVTTMTPALALVTFLIVALLVYGLFARSERQLDPGTRQQIGDYLRRDRPSIEDERAFTRGFIEWFDHVFAVRTRRLPLLGEVPLPNFWRSVTVTVVSLAFLAIVWLCNKPGMSRALAFAGELEIPKEQAAELLLVYGAATIVSNWIPDYLSLVESRWVLAKLTTASSWLRRIGWLVVDAVATLAISFFAIHLSFVVMLPMVTPEWTIEVGCLTPERYSLATTWELFWSGLRFHSPPGTINYDATGIYIYSTFLTSLWVWIYLGSGLLLRAARGVFGVRELRSGHAMRTMAVLAIVLVGSLYWSNWLHRRMNGAEVYIEHGEAHTAQALALARELEARGLWVETRAHVDSESDGEHDETLLRNAEVVIVIDAPQLDASKRELAEQVRCGERSAWSTAVVRADIDSDWVMEFVKLAPSMLPKSEVWNCRELMELPIETQGCDGRRR